MVSAYINNESIEVQLTESNLVHINQLFIKIEGQQISDLHNDMRIYYGKAWINKSPNNNGFIVRFTNVLKHNELSVRPSFFIHDELLKKSACKKYQQETLETLFAKGKLVNVYILSEFKPYINDKYINFKL